MTTYNTGNPVGSTEVKDLYDNAQNFDTLANTTTLETVPDRLGVPRMTLHGFEQEAKRRFESIKFQPPIPYAPGIEVTTSSLTVDYMGVIYYALPSALPFTTGAWNPAQWSPVQNTNPGHELLVFDDYASASAAAATLPDGQRVEIEADETQGLRRTAHVAKDGALVYQGLSSDAESTAFTPAGAGGVDSDVSSKLGQMPSVLDYTSTANAISAAVSSNFQLRVDRSMTVRVPTDAATLQQAFDVIAPVSQNVRVTVLIEAGHRITHGLRLENGNYSNFVIAAEDAEVKLATGFVPVPSTEWPAGDVRQAIFAWLNCSGPLLGALFNAELVSQDINGLMCGFGGDYKVATGCGVKGTRVNLEARECSYHGPNTIWDDAFEMNARFTSGVLFSGRNSSYKRSFRNPALTSDPRSGGVLVSRGSHGTLQDSIFEDHPYSAISARRSHINLIGAQFNSVTPYAVAFWDGAIVIVNSEVLVDGNPIAESNINLGGFNGIFKSGMCLNSNKNPIQITSDENGTLVKYADGFAQVFSPDFTVNMATVEGSGYKSPVASWDYSSLVSLHDSRRQISGSLTTSHIAFPMIRSIAGNKVNHSVVGFTSATGVSYRLVVSGYWGNIS